MNHSCPENSRTNLYVCNGMSFEIFLGRGFLRIPVMRNFISISRQDSRVSTFLKPFEEKFRERRQRKWLVGNLCWKERGELLAFVKNRRRRGEPGEREKAKGGLTRGNIKVISITGGKQERSIIDDNKELPPWWNEAALKSERVSRLTNIFSS